MKIELGMIAKDRITGFTGVVTGHCRHITGCDTYGLTPQELKDSKTVDQHWFDENRIEVIDESGLSDIYAKAKGYITEANAPRRRAASGGPQDAPKPTNTHP